MSSDYIKAAINPDWDGFDAVRVHVHDWRTYITDSIRAKWDEIPIECRCMLIEVAQSVANNECWS